MKTGRTTRNTDTMRAFAILAITLAKGATPTKSADASAGYATKPSKAVDHA